MVMAASGLRNLSFRSKLPFNQSIRMFLYKCFSPTYPCSISKLGRTVSNLKMDFWGHEAAIAINLVTAIIVKNCSFCLEKSLIIIFSAEVHGQKVNAPPPPWHICVYAPKTNPLKRMCVESSCPLSEIHIINSQREKNKYFNDLYRQILKSLRWYTSLNWCNKSINYNYLKLD